MPTDPPLDPPLDPRITAPIPARHAENESQLAVQFVALTVLIVGAALVGAWILTQLFGRNPDASPWTMVFPPAFAFSSLLLLRGSYCLGRALAAVKRERQVEFRAWLVRGLQAGGLFVAVQSYALWAISPSERGASATSLGVRPFIMLLCLLHVLHFLVAIMSLSYVTVRAYADKYDHEYHWGVTVCASLWHFLGVVWIGVLAVIAIAL